MGGHSCTAIADSTKNNKHTGYLINRLREFSPTVNMVFNQHGSAAINDYLERIIPEPIDAYQSSQDLYKVVYDLIKPLLGKKIAKQASEDIAAQPFVLTANHHGVDFFAQSVQGTIIFGLKHKAAENAAGNDSQTTIPVFACGNIPLNNLTYPRGILVYSLPTFSVDNIPAKIPIFPDRLKRKMVSRVERFDHSMVERTLQHIHKMTKKREMSAEVSDTLTEILTNEYASEDILSFDSYSEQAVVLNNRLWRRMFTHSEVPELVYLEIEKIVAELLAFDLQNDNSLFRLLMFDPKILQKMLRELEGVRVCWRRDNLTRRMLDGDPRRINANNCGTCFFWGIDEQGMRVPLLCIPEEKGKNKLTGLDDKGKQYEFSLNPDALIAALKKEQILPSLFTCYTVLSLARGIVCAGGYYQAEYLPKVQHGVANALAVCSEYQEVAQKIRYVPTKTYLSGMQTVMCRGHNDLLIPAGPIETIVGGGLSASDMEKIKKLSVREAHIASLFDTIEDLPLDTPWGKHQKQELADECGQILKDSIVIK